MRVPLADLSAQYRALQDDIDQAVQRVLAGGRFINGEEVEAFESEFAAYVDAVHAVAVGNGTDALALALQASGLPPGAKVLVPAHTFHATVEAVYLAGMQPVVTDVHPESLLLDADALRRALTDSIRAVVPVHLYGYPAAMEAIVALAGERNLVVIEDAAQAHGCRLAGRHAGTWGAAGAFSFFPGKTLGAYGDGGMIVTGDNTLADTARRLRNHGRPARAGEHGRNSRLDEMQAAVLRVKLRHLDAWVERRRDIEARYRERLPENRGFAFLPAPPQAEIAPLNVVIRTARRDALATYLAERGIEAKPHYAQTVVESDAYRHLTPADGPPANAIVAARTVLSLPNYPEMTDAQVDYVIDAVAAFLEDNPSA
ncbi:MAG: DegT/DnrJ/EryC1/StrS family aminotransferase [Candidatus Lernaella stagnicola]|nr:DegT/DnrJ/EryC1/StrS family aminotransferase [Candidatus Lernaella stagnicola]